MSVPTPAPVGADPLPRYLRLVLPALDPAVAQRLEAVAAALAAAAAAVAAAQPGAGPRGAAVLARRADTLDAVGAELGCVLGVLADLAAVQAATAARAERAVDLWWSATASLPPWSPLLGGVARLVCACLDGVRADHAADLAVLTASLTALADGAAAATLAAGVG